MHRTPQNLLQRIISPPKGCYNTDDHPQGRTMGHAEGWPIRAYLQSHPHIGTHRLLVVWEHPVSPVIEFAGRVPSIDTGTAWQQARRCAGDLLAFVNAGTHLADRGSLPVMPMVQEALL